jgi:hypothetical protein
MPRKNNDNNPLQIRLRVKSLPKSVTPAKLYRRLIQHLQNPDISLPPLWDIEVWWRNPNTKHGLTRKWRSDDFESAVSGSREGFNMLLHDALVRRLRTVTR